MLTYQEVVRISVNPEVYEPLGEATDEIPTCTVYIVAIETCATGTIINFERA